MDEALGTLISRTTQEAEDAVLAALRQELRALGAEQADILRQLGEANRQDRTATEAWRGRQQELQTSQGAALKALGAELSTAVARLRADITAIDEGLRKQMEAGRATLQGRQEAAAAESSRRLDALLKLVNTVGSQVAALPAALAQQERMLAVKQDSLHRELGDLQRGLPEHFYSREELRQLLASQELEQQASLTRNVRAMRQQILIAQILGGLAAIGTLVTVATLML